MQIGNINHSEIGAQREGRFGLMMATLWLTAILSKVALAQEPKILLTEG